MYRPVIVLIYESLCSTLYSYAPRLFVAPASSFVLTDAMAIESQQASSSSRVSFYRSIDQGQDVNVGVANTSESECLSRREHACTRNLHCLNDRASSLRPEASETYTQQYLVTILVCLELFANESNVGTFFLSHGNVGRSKIASKPTKRRVTSNHFDENFLRNGFMPNVFFTLASILNHQ